MRHPFVLGCCLILAGWAFTLHAEDAAAPQSKAIPAELQAAVTQAEFLGRQLYLHDRAAWLATDVMLADKRMRELKAQVRGWVTEPTAHGIRVIFIGETNGPRRLYEIEVDEGERLSEATVESSTPLNAEHLAQVRARKLALSQSFATCAKTYNTVVMPSMKGLRVYLMPAFTTTGVYPLGGYHLYEIDNDGEKVLSSRKFTNGCIEHNDSPEAHPKGSVPTFAMFTHLLDPQPTEIHVFISQHAKIPLMIMAIDNKTLWSVQQGRIAYLETMD